MQPLVAIVGRPNVGKSSVFNRIVGKRKALVRDQPGITRDRQYAEADWDGFHFRLVDTGGLEFDPQTSIEDQMAKQALFAVEEADLVLLMMDGRAGVTTLDEEWAHRVRMIKKPKFFVVNKIDAEKEATLLAYFYELGITDLIPVSAETGRGVADLLDRIVEELKKTDTKTALKNEDEINEKVVKRSTPQGCCFAEGQKVEKKPIRHYMESSPNAPINLALIGRPNVGKSTLLNQLCGWERAIVHNAPGTTRDPVDTDITVEGRDYKIIDTAGIRRRGKTNEVIEKFSVIKSLKTMEDAQMVLFLIDANEGVTEQDAHVAGEAFKANKIILVLLNKWDAAEENKKQEEVLEELKRKLQFMEYAPVIFISAKTGKGVSEIFPALTKLWEEANRFLNHDELRERFEAWADHHALPVFRGKNIELKNIRQAEGHPPAFIVRTPFPDKVHFSYQRYLINCIRKDFDFEHVPIKMVFRK